MPDLPDAVEKWIFDMYDDEDYKQIVRPIIRYALCQNESPVQRLIEAGKKVSKRGATPSNLAGLDNALHALGEDV